MESATPRTWFVTGTSSGLGRALIEALLGDGHRVAATVRGRSRLDDLKDVYGDRLWVGDLDVTDTVALRRVVDDAFGELGRIDHVVSNAAYGLYGAAEEFTDDDIGRLLAVNLIAPIQLLRAAVPHLRRQGGGHYVQISSLAGQTGIAGASIYHASKWGVEGFVESLHEELAPFGVGLTVVEPGSIDSDFFARLDVASAIEAYRDGPVGALRDYLSDRAAVKRDAIGDPRRMARAIIEAAEAAEPPRRLVLGSDAYEWIEKALHSRLSALRSQEAAARSTNR
ncbi:SDR family oxidoreductase [Streptomyces sp. Inha503]|uniref:SDR family oxidoreductase n=1 Tax=Streptomyces sp. Inha503 TaxID=3383314 RepID=UPI0039A1A74E